MADRKLKPPAGSTKTKRIVGRGNGSGRGGTSGRGSNGQNSRSGGGVRLGFEGGQMPLFRRIARRGFSNYPFKKHFEVVNVGELEKRFESGETVTLDALRRKRLISKGNTDVKILGNGELTKSLTVDVPKVSASAAEKIVKAGGSVIGAEAAPEVENSVSEPVNDTEQVKTDGE